MADIALDPVAFSTRVLGIAPFEHTHAALRSTAGTVLIKGGRRSAKTASAQLKALWVIFTNAGGKVLVTGPNGDNVARFVGETVDMLRGGELSGGATVDLNRLRIGLANGSELIGLPPTHGQIRGYGRDVLLVVVDEAGHSAHSVWRDLRYVLLDERAQGSQAWLIGSPWGAADHFFNTEYRRGEMGDPDYHVERWRTDQNPKLPADWIARERARMNSLEAAAELDGEDIGDATQFYSVGLIEDCTADFEVRPLDSVPWLGARPILSLDWGVSYDQTSAIVLYRTICLNGDGGPSHPDLPRFLALPYLWPAGYRMLKIVDEICESSLPRQAMFVASDAGGVGASPSQELVARFKQARRSGQTFAVGQATGQRKLAGHSTIRWLMERGQLVLPRDVQLRRQLAGLRYEVTLGGTPKLEALDPAVHDDLADALWAAALPYSRGDRMVSALSALANPETALPNPPLERLEADVVTTGAGLEVYQWPVLMSVAPEKSSDRSLSVSMPAGATVQADGDDRPKGWNLIAPPGWTMKGSGLARPRVAR